jgi:hypothetical protein
MEYPVFTFLHLHITCYCYIFLNTLPHGLRVDTFMSPVSVGVNLPSFFTVGPYAGIVRTRRDT